MKRQKTNPISGGKRKLETNDEVDATSTKRVQSNPLSHVSSAESGETSNVGLDRAICSPAGVSSTDLRQDSATAHRLVPGLSDATERNAIPNASNAGPAAAAADPFSSQAAMNSGPAAAAADPFPSQAATPLSSDAPKPDEDFLKRVFATNPLFKNLRAEEVRPLADRFQLASFAAGVPIIREGERADRFYILLSGRCTISTRLEGTVQTVARGDSFGEWGLLRNAPRAATVLTEEPVSAWYLEASAFHLAMRSSDRPPAARPPGPLPPAACIPTPNPLPLTPPR